MKIANLTFTAGFLAITIGMFYPPEQAQAQSSPSSDSFKVALLHPITISGKVLQPGSYSMEPLNIAGGDSAVLVIRADSGDREEVSAAISPTYVSRPARDTRVLLRHIGKRYYFDTIWVKNQYYGYKFTMPKNVVARAGER